MMNSEFILNEEAKNELIQLARESVDHGLRKRRPLDVHLDEVRLELRQQGASFVTLSREGQLRGCIGSLLAHRSLAMDVADNAFAAAFRDPRFPPIERSELEQLEIKVSVLTPSQEIFFKSEADLLDQIQPGKDGLVLQHGRSQGTFLPSVWEQVPEKQDFLRHLKRKAGLDADFWSPELRVERYHTIEFGE